MTWLLVTSFCYAMARAVGPFGRDRLLAAEYFEGVPAGVVFFAWMLDGVAYLTPIRMAMDILFRSRGWR